MNSETIQGPSITFEDGRRVYSEYEIETFSNVHNVKIGDRVMKWDFGQVFLGPARYFCEWPDGTVKKTSLLAEMHRPVRKKGILGRFGSKKGL